jgi:signal transduction histidine kinase
VVRVEDQGCGFDPNGHRDGLGLVSMRERLTPLGGEVEIRSRPRKGTVVEARVPLGATKSATPSAPIYAA